jgi:hypothetical protein
LAFGNDISIEIRVQVGASVMTSPAVGMESSDGVGIVSAGVEILHSRQLFRHRGLLIDPGIGTAQEPAAGPSKGQVPQVTLDERPETIRGR